MPKPLIIVSKNKLCNLNTFLRKTQMILKKYGKQ